LPCLTKECDQNEKNGQISKKIAKTVGRAQNAKIFAAHKKTFLQKSISKLK